jgi:hypothetical protein
VIDEATSRGTRVTNDPYGTVTERARPRRRSRLLTVLISLLVILAILGVAADRVAAHYADQELRKQVAAELNRSDVAYESLDVGIGGFPFLTQVARGSYDKITIDLTEVALPEDTAPGVVLPKLHVEASGVDADTQQVIDGTAKVNAKQVTGTAVVGFSTLNNAIDYSAYRLSNVTFSESDGGLKATGRANLGAVEVPISATADLSVVNGQIQIQLRDIEAVNLPAPALLTNYLTDLAQNSLTAQLPKLPFGLTLNQVTVDSDGLAISATGQDVPLTN